MKIRFCEQCGKNIANRNKNARFCKQCARERAAEVNRRNSRRYRKENLKKYLEISKRCSKRKTAVVRFFMEKYECTKIKDLYEMIKKGEIQ